MPEQKGNATNTGWIPSISTQRGKGNSGDAVNGLGEGQRIKEMGIPEKKPFKREWRKLRGEKDSFRLVHWDKEC